MQWKFPFTFRNSSFKYFNYVSHLRVFISRCVRCLFLWRCRKGAELTQIGYRSPPVITQPFSFLHRQHRLSFKSNAHQCDPVNLLKIRLCASIGLELQSRVFRLATMSAFTSTHASNPMIFPTHLHFFFSRYVPTTWSPYWHSSIVIFECFWLVGQVRNARQLIVHSGDYFRDVILHPFLHCTLPPPSSKYLVALVKHRDCYYSHTNIIHLRRTSLDFIRTTSNEVASHRTTRTRGLQQSACWMARKIVCNRIAFIEKVLSPRWRLLCHPMEVDAGPSEDPWKQRYPSVQRP